ncbi:MAG: 3(2),5-bisphosphate nucleotidase CysQ [Hydrocarboniphaga sp.]|uniref:3'(2'),5'-bisphosphate nucleotidase CysQ n=1 Tax=Hydrocarboniphaga sp. TaxID=2033016 RepID=UPI002624AD5B|nr:3'(2'),5'-bisphosphate nucleotidase CysQ [Hydrocarboniphaga sp.]MDB5972909.1 3(2),5-bisphosphate nucleotidase CysQ [Hydrocarboniphaga sp.]
MKPVDLLQAVQGIAEEAGRRIMQVRDSADFGITEKADRSPLTRADMAAHRHIAKALKALTPSIPLLSEEDADIAFEIRRSWSRYWLVDPLDGTKEFIARNADFTVNIALIEDGYPVLGVVVAPALDVGYYAAQGAGAFQIQRGLHSELHTRRVPSTPVFVVSRSHKNPELEAFLAAAPEHEARSRGSSLKFCQIAAGEADLYPRTGPTSEWDTGAGQCVAEQAGARVLRLPDLSRLRYNQKDSLLNPLFAVIGDSSFDWKPLLATIPT